VTAEATFTSDPARWMRHLSDCDVAKAMAGELEPLPPFVPCTCGLEEWFANNTESVNDRRRRLGLVEPQ
jgi:hypothetical protein